MNRKKRQKRIKKSSQRLILALEKHMGVTLSYEGRGEDWMQYAASTAALRRALERFAEAEFAWCGSTPYALVDWDSSDASEDSDDELTTKDAETMLLTGAWEFRIEDDAAVLKHGRRAYAKLWPSDDVKEVAWRVSDAPSAIMEVLHYRSFDTLQIKGIQTLQSEYGIRGKTVDPAPSESEQ